MSTPVKQYKHWVRLVALHFSMPFEDLINTKIRTDEHARARAVFYGLCIRNGIDLYRLAEHLGKYRTTFYTSFRKYKHNVKPIIDLISNVNKMTPDEQKIFDAVMISFPATSFETAYNVAIQNGANFQIYNHA